MLDNIFLPIFECTVNPEADPRLASFLKEVSAFDSVDDESKSTVPKDRNFSSKVKDPADWNISDNPSYKYYNYFMHSNLRVLNQLRASLNLNQFQYRPHAGEAGELHHLDTAYLLADSIAHGINLRQSMPLQYLFYLSKVGIGMSPCSNNHLFLSYAKSPFQEFFMRGLNVSLSTDDPLMFHQTKEPLMEEYSLAKQFFRLSSPDLCELARNSVLQSGFSSQVKAQWLGSADSDFNDITKTNVPEVRLHYRRTCHDQEMRLVDSTSETDTMARFREGIPGYDDCLSPKAEAAPIKAVSYSNGTSLLTLPIPARGRSSSQMTARQNAMPIMEAALPYVAPEAADGFDSLQSLANSVPAGDSDGGPPRKVHRTE
jgi:AMP deaminase